MSFSLKYYLIALLVTPLLFAEPAYVEGQLIVKMSGTNSLRSARSTLNSEAFRVDSVISSSRQLFLVKTNANFDTKKALKRLRARKDVVFAQLDHYVTKREIKPDDPKYLEQWALQGGAGANIQAPTAWKLGVGGRDRDGNDLVVAVVDGGLDVNHKDLAGNLWINEKEIAGNGIDDDENGYIDDIYGWSAYSDSGEIRPDNHGTHVAGIIGARGNNGVQVSGVNWEVKVMAVGASSGFTSIVLKGYQYVLDQKKLWLETGGKKGANVVATNSSFGVDEADCTSGDYPAWDDMYNAMGEVGILSAAATANEAWDIDTVGDVPTGCSSDFLITVTNTTADDELNPFAGWGKTQIDLGAPGTKVLSTLSHDSIGKGTGTSMATPHVAGAVAFLHSVASEAFASLVKTDPKKATLAIKETLITQVDPNADLKDVTVSGGRLNLAKSAEAISKYTVAR